MLKNRIEIGDKEYYEKRYEVSKEILAGAITHEKIDTMGDTIQRQSLVFNCIAIADILLEELGYTRKMSSDHASIRNLKDLLQNED